MKPPPGAPKPLGADVVIAPNAPAGFGPKRPPVAVAAPAAGCPNAPVAGDAPKVDVVAPNSPVPGVVAPNGLAAAVAPKVPNVLVAVDVAGCPKAPKPVFAVGVAPNVEPATPTPAVGVPNAEGVWLGVENKPPAGRAPNVVFAAGVDPKMPPAVDVGCGVPNRVGFCWPPNNDVVDVLAAAEAPKPPLVD